MRLPDVHNIWIRYKAKQTRLNVFDIRTDESRPTRSFDASKNSEYFQQIKIGESDFKISAFKCDDVKVVCGKNNGDIQLWDIRNESIPIWIKSTAMECGLENRRGRAFNYSRQGFWTHIVALTVILK